VTAASATEPLSARLDAIADRLDELTARLERAHDSRCVFSHSYAIMTRRIALALVEGRAVDAEWVVSLAEAFAGRYFAAVAAYDRHECDSEAWVTVLDALTQKRTSVLEDLIFAMTAHIVHDLPLALGDVSPPSGPEPSRVRDFHAVNDMMASSIPSIQAAVARRYGSYVRWLDRLAENYDEIVTNYGIRMARGLAWYNAVRLHDPLSETDARAAIEHSPALVVRNVLRPPFRPARWLLRVSRILVSVLRTWPSDPPPSAAVAAAIARAEARA
jgi:hypothetical protein